MKLCSGGAGHGYWAHLRRGEADTDWGTRTHALVFSAHLHTPTDTTPSLSFLNALSFSLQKKPKKQLDGDPTSADIRVSVGVEPYVFKWTKGGKKQDLGLQESRPAECQSASINSPGWYLNATPRSH